MRKPSPGPRREAPGRRWQRACVLLGLPLALLACQRAVPAPRVAGAGEPLEVALTFDDLPATGPEVPGTSRVAILASLLETLRRHGVASATGFVNASHGAEESPELRAALAAWLAAGHPLGNHTFSHPDLAQVGAGAFVRDIARNEPLLRELAGPGTDERTWKVFRYPYLEEGADGAARAAVRGYLAAQGYRLAPVSVDFSDWAWNEPYARCLARGDARALEALRTSYVSQALAALRWSDVTARQLLGRPMRHILLLHVGAFDAQMLDALLGAYAQAGVRFIPLDAALEDPVHRLDPGVTHTRNDTLLHQLLEARRTPHAPPAKPLALLDALCR